MDVQMPVMDGNDAVREIRKKPRFAKLPIVALTAGALLRERTKALASGHERLSYEAGCGEARARGGRA